MNRNGKSNIVSKSNLYPCDKNKDPRFDQDFIIHVTDVTKLKAIKVAIRQFILDEKLENWQLEYLENDMRCVFAKDDPCWGIVKSNKDGHKMTRSFCINSDCPKLMECNPDYTAKYGEKWDFDIDNQRQYYYAYYPSRKYFEVGEISKEEQLSYITAPETSCTEFSAAMQTNTNRALKGSPINRKRRGVISMSLYRDNNYGDEQIEVEYGNLDDYDTSAPKVKVQSGNEEKEVFQKKSEKKEDIPQILIVKNSKVIEKGKKQITEKKDVPVGKMSKLVRTVSARCEGICSISQLNDDKIEEYAGIYGMVIVADNPAEAAYISSMLEARNIEHSLNKQSDLFKVCILPVQDFDKVDKERTVMVTSTLLQSGCNQNSYEGWENIQKASQLLSLKISGKRYLPVLCSDGKVRWCCGNNVELTHVCVDTDDIKFSNHQMGVYEVNLVFDDDRNKYYLIDQDEVVIGETKPGFMNMFSKLMEKDQIDVPPSMITGLKLDVKSLTVFVRGLGHFSHDQY